MAVYRSKSKETFGTAHSRCVFSNVQTGKEKNNQMNLVHDAYSFYYFVIIVLIEKWSSDFKKKRCQLTGQRNNPAKADT